MAMNLSGLLGSNWQSRVPGTYSYGASESGGSEPLFTGTSAASVGNVFGDGKNYYFQKDANGNGYGLWTDHGDYNLAFDNEGNFTHDYAGNEPFGLRDLAAGALTVAGGMGLGSLLSAGMAGAGASAAGGGLLGDATTAGYGGLDAASAATMGGGASVAGGSALGSLGAGAAGAGGFLSNPIISKVLGNLGTSALSGLGGQSSSNAGSLGGILSGLYDKYQQDKAADHLLEYMNTQQKKIDDVYDPNGPRAKYLFEEMSRKDAAAGRNSQYGPRTADFLGKFGGEYANATANMARGLAGNYGQAFNQQASSGAGLSAGIGNFLQGSNVSLLDIINAVNNSPVTNASSFVGDGVSSGVPAWDAAYQNAGGLGGVDYGEYL